MELLAELRVGWGAGALGLEVRIVVPATTTVGELRAALVDHVEGLGGTVPPDARLWLLDERPGGAGPVALPEAEPVARTRLASGATLVLDPAEPAVAPRPPLVEVAVTAGPDMGPPTLLGPGRHRVGGTSADEVCILGADLPAAAVELVVADDGTVVVLGPDGARRSLPADGAGTELDLGPAAVRVRRLHVPPPPADGSGTVPLHRAPHRPVVVHEVVLPAVPAPPAPPGPNRLAITSFVVPLASGLGFAVVFGSTRFLVIALLAPLALLAVSSWERRRGRRGHGALVAEHAAAVARARRGIAAALDAEVVVRRRALPALGDLVAAVSARHPTTWCRGLDAPDLLRARLGRAALASSVRVAVAPGGDPDAAAELGRRLAEDAATVEDVPVELDWEETAVVGLHGPADVVDGVARSVLGQVVAAHGPEDVVVAALLGPDALPGFGWLRWLPHVRSPASPLSGDHVAVWPDDVAVLLAELVDVAAERAAAAHPGDVAAGARLVVVVHEGAAVDLPTLGRLLGLAGPAGVRVLWVGRAEGRVPRGCDVLCRVADGPGATVVSRTDPYVADRACTVEPADVATALALARSLSPLRDAGSTAGAAALPDVVGLLDVLVPGGGVADGAAVAAAWAAAPSDALAAPLGAGPAGPLEVDLVGSGPHALVAGTSGAGKSELLQSWVAALAARYPPWRCTFLFVDYKGGAAAAPFVDLPHLVGVVTNLDERLARRALTSLRAELDRRMALLAGGDGQPPVRDLDELAAVDPDRCPPRLVVVVDEFATLADEVPELVAGMVDLAQRGRSLGIHLVLATQRPAGAVREDIQANATLRVALRTVDAAGSQQVVGVPDAAEIPVPRRGRALVRLGPTDLVALQSAWSGAPLAGAARGVEVSPLGAGRPAGAGSRTDEVGAPTHLDAVLAAVDSAWAAAARPEPRRPWLPPLPDVVPLADVPVPEHGPRDPGRCLVLGIRDDPARQRRVPAVVDLDAEGGLLVVGSGGSGRTTALRTAVASAVAGASPDEVQVVVLDAAGRGLAALGDLPHVRAVVGPEDLARCTRAIDLLAAEVAERQDRLARAGVPSLTALRSGPVGADRTAPPRILVVVDGYGALHDALDDPAGYAWAQALARTLVDGRAAGVHAVVAADRRADLPAAVLGAVSARLVLRSAEPEAMAALGVPLALARATHDAPGRGWLRGDEEVQVAVVGGDPDPRAQDVAVADLARASGSDARAPRLVALADSVARPGPDEGALVGLGMGHDGPVTLDLAAGHLLVLGPPGSGRSTACLAVCRGVLAAGTAPLVVVAGPRSPLPDVLGAVAPPGPDAALRVLVDDAEAAAVLDELAALPATDRSVRAVVVVDDADEVTAASARAIEAVAGSPVVRVVAAADVGAVGRAFTGWAPVLRRGRRTLLLQPEGPAEVDQVTGVRVRMRPGEAFPVGRGLLVEGRTSTLVQVAAPGA